MSKDSQYVYKNKFEENNDTIGFKQPATRSVLQPAILSKGVIQRSTKGEKIPPVLEDVVIHEPFSEYKILDLNKQELIKSDKMPDERVDFALNLDIPAGEEDHTYLVYFMDKLGKTVGSKYLKPRGASKVVVRTLSMKDYDEQTSLAAKCKNRAKVEARMKELQNDSSLAGKMYLHDIQSGDNIYKLSEQSLSYNQSNQSNFYRKLVSINKDLSKGTIGDCYIYLKGWVDPNIGSLPKKPGLENLTPEAKEAIAVIYAEQSGQGPKAKEQQLYIWYTMVRRVKDPSYSALLYGVATSGSYQAYGNSNYKSALDQLDKNNPVGAVKYVRDMVLNNWSDTVPGNAGRGYFHWWKKHMDPYLNKATGATEDAKEKEAAYNYAKDNQFNVTGITKETGWLHKIASDEGTKEGSMYIYP